MYACKATVSLIEPLVIPDLFLKCGELKADFQFLGSVADYAQYYVDLERSLAKKVKFHQPVEIPELGLLRPLRRSHSFHSFWRCFRLFIETTKTPGESLDELFLFLPLEVKLPIEPIRVNNRRFGAELRVHLFPFGPCITNVDIEVDNLRFADLIDLIRNLSGTRIRSATATGKVEDLGTFKKFSQSIATQITVALFGNQRFFSPFSLHTMLFVEETSPALNYSSDHHKRAIKAAMTGRTLEDISSETTEAVEEYFELTKENKKLKLTLRNKRLGEILIFKPKVSFFYKSPFWSDEYGPICMRNNYTSFLIVLFALNRFLKVCPPKKKALFPKARLFDLQRAFSLAFPPNLHRIYYKHAYSIVATSIGLDDALKEASNYWR